MVNVMLVTAQVAAGKGPGAPSILFSNRTLSRCKPDGVGRVDGGNGPSDGNDLAVIAAKLGSGVYEAAGFAAGTAGGCVFRAAGWPTRASDRGGGRC